MITIDAIVGNTVLFAAAFLSTAWWVYSLSSVVRMQLVRQPAEVAATTSRRFNLRIRLPSLKFSPRKWIENWVFTRIEAYLKSVKVSWVTALFVYVVQPLVVVGGLTNKVGAQWAGYLMLGIVAVNWIILGLTLLERFQCRSPQESPVNKPQWCRILELVLYAVPVVYTWYQFFTAIG